MENREACTNTTDLLYSKEQLERCKKNKEKAMELRKGRTRAHPYSKSKPYSREADSVVPSSTSNDTHAGYIIERESTSTEHIPVYRKAAEIGE